VNPATPEDVIAAAIKAGLSTYMPNHHLNAESIIGQLAAAGYAVVPAADVAAARLRELCGFLIDACAEHGIPVPLNSSLLDLAADIAADGGAAAVGSVNPEGKPTVEVPAKAITNSPRWPPARPSVDPEGEATPVGITVDTEQYPVGITVQTPARPSVDPEGESVPLTVNPKLLSDDVRAYRPTLREPDRVAAPARPSVCPTCGSDDPVVYAPGIEYGQAVARRCLNPWHSPDPDRGT
jgi:hypothetical protein